MGIFDLKEADYYDSKLHTDREIYEATKYKPEDNMRAIILHNLKDWSFGILGPYKLTEEEAKYIIFALGGKNGT